MSYDKLSFNRNLQELKVHVLELCLIDRKIESTFNTCEA